MNNGPSDGNKQQPAKPSSQADPQDLHASLPPIMPLSKNATLDLHGMSVDQALIALDGFLLKMSQLDYPVACVIHGKGDGKLKKAVYIALGGYYSDYVESFGVDPNNPGVTYLQMRN